MAPRNSPSRESTSGSRLWLPFAAETQARLLIVDRLRDHRGAVDDGSLHRRADVTVQGDVAHRGPLVDDDELGPVRAHDRLDLLEHRPGGAGRLEVRPAHRAREVVELLQGAETVREAQVAPVGEHDQGTDGHEGEDRPGVPPGGVEDDKGERDARDEHERNRGELEAVLAALGMAVQMHDDGDGEVAVEERRAERDGAGRPADGENRGHAEPWMA